MNLNYIRRQFNFTEMSLIIGYYSNLTLFDQSTRTYDIF